MLKGMQDSDPDVATAAAKSLTELNPHGDTKAVSTLLSLLKHQKESFRLSAMAVLETVAESGDPDVLEGVCNLLEDKSMIVRRTVARSLSRLAPRGHPGAIRGLYLRLWHPNTEVRCATLRAMGKAAAIGSEKELNEVLKGLLDKDARVRIHALEAIIGVAEKGDPTAVAGVQACISDSLGITDTQLRNRAIQTLAQLTGEDGEDGQGVAIAHQPWIEQGLATADGNNTEEPEDTDFHFIPTPPVRPEDMSKTKETQIFREAPLSSTAAVGPINDMVFFWKRGRISMMDMSMCRTSDHKKAFYSNLENVYLAHANVRTQAIFPGIRDSKFNVVIGPLRKGTGHVLIFVYTELALEMPLDHEPALYVGEKRSPDVLYPVAQGRGRVLPLREVLPGWERMDENTLCAATGEWDDEFGRTFWVFVDDKVWVFERKHQEHPVRQRHPPRKIKEFIPGGPAFVESVVGPIACVECRKEKGWTMRRVLYLFAGAILWEYDIKNKTCVVRERPAALPDDILDFDPSLSTFETISRVSSTDSAMAMEDNERDRHEALKRRRMDVENQVGAMKELFRASRDQKLVDVGHKVARHIILEGVIPHVLEVLGEYTIIDDIWERSDRPLYLRSSIGLRSERKSDIYMYWVWKGTSTLDPNGSGWWVIGDAPGAEDAALCVESDAMDPTQIKNRWMYWDGEAWQDAPDNFHVVAMDSNFDAHTSKQHLTDAIKRHKEKSDKKPSKGLEMERIGNEKKAAKTDFEIIEKLREGIKGSQEKTGGRRKSRVDDLALFQQYHQAKQDLMDGMKAQRKAGEEKLVAWLAAFEKKDEASGKEEKKRHVVWGWLDKLNSNSDGSDQANWRARLCVSIDGIFKYVSEKQSGQFVKICDFRNVDRVALTGFESANRLFCMEILFSDESKIVFSAATEFERARWEEEIARVIKEVDEAGGESPPGHFPEGDELGLQFATMEMPSEDEHDHHH